MNIDTTRAIVYLVESIEGVDDSAWPTTVALSGRVEVVNADGNPVGAITFRGDTESDIEVAAD